MFPEYFPETENGDTSFPYNFSIQKLDRSFKKHTHGFVEFSFVLEGSGAQVINGTAYRVKPGAFVFILPHQVHEIVLGPNDKLIVFNCSIGLQEFFEPSRIGGELHRLVFEEEGLPAFLQLEGRQAEEIHALMDSMQAEFTGREVGRELLFRARLMELVVRLRRISTREVPSGTLREEPALPHSLVWKIVHYLNGHYHEELSLSQTASRFAISRSYLCMLLKSQTGRTFHEIIRTLRIRHACGLLRSTDMTLTEVASQAGFNSYGTFSRVFQQEMGAGPKQYRAQRSDSLR